MSRFEYAQGSSPTGRDKSDGRERKGFIVVQVWTTITYTDTDGQFSKGQ